MDSITQFTLGAVIGHAVVGKTAQRKAIIWGGIIATLPDLDVLFSPFLNDMESLAIHRGYSHAWLIQLMVAPLIALLPWLIHYPKKNTKSKTAYWRWLLVVVLALTTHSLIDLFTVYGTQIFLPFTDKPYALNNLFIVDPLFTFPLLLATFVGLIYWRSVKLSKYALIVTLVYSMFSLAAYQWVSYQTPDILAQKRLPKDKVLVSAAPLTTFLWRIITVDDKYWYEGYYSLFKGAAHVQFKKYDRNTHLYSKIKGNPSLKRLFWFNRGFYRYKQHADTIILQDLRFGEGNDLRFNWLLAEQNTKNQWIPINPAIQTWENTETPDDFFKTLFNRIF